MMEAHTAGDNDTVRSLQERANRCIRLMKMGTGLPELKAGLELVGIECNGCRKPIKRVEQSAIEEIWRTLEEMGVL